MKIKGLYVAILFVLFCLDSLGQTDLSGIISKDSILAKSRSPYNLTGALTIRNNAKLTIENGCVINMGSYNIIAGSSSMGYLVAKSVAFSTTSSSEKNIDFKDGGQAELENCSFNKVYIRLEDDAGSTLIFRNNSFTGVTSPFKISPNVAPVISGNSSNVQAIGLQGNVNKTKNLSKLQWDYVLTGVVNIQNNATLTIDENVVIDVMNYAFNAGYTTPGTLNANRVTFNCSYSYRGELTFRDGGGGNITNCSFNHLRAVIESDAGNTLSFTGNTFSNVDFPFELDVNRKPVISGNNCSVRKISLKGNVNEDVTLNKYEWDYTLGSNVTINKSKTLTIGNGIKIDLYRFYISAGNSSAGKIMLANSILSSTYSSGGFIYFRDGGSGTVTNNTFDHAYIKIEDDAANDISVTNNQFSNITYPIELSANRSPVISGNTSPVKLIGLCGSVITSTTLPKYQWDFKLKEYISIRSNSTLTIADSATVDLGTTYLNVGSGSSSIGTLNASRVYFKGSPDNRGRINFNNSSGGNLNRCSFDQAYIKIDNCSPSFQNCRFFHSETAIEVKNAANPVIDQNDFYNNSLSIKNTGTLALNAENNYWGHASGPQITGNPTGIGELLEGNITYIPFKTQPNTGIVNNTLIPSDFQLGMLATGTRIDTSFTIANTGDIDLLISGIRTNKSTISVKSYDRFWLHADSTLLVSFSYTPLESGARTDTILIATNRTVNPDQKIPVSTIGRIESLNINFNKIDIDSFALVKCYFTVTDQANIPIGDIQKANLVLKEDGNIITDFQFITKRDVSSPVAAVLVVDQSGSMLGQKLRDAKSAAVDFVNELAPNDIATVFSFNEKVMVREKFTSEKSELIKSIGYISSMGETAIFNAIAQAIDSVKNKPGNKAIIALTDGQDNRSNVTPDLIVAMALQYGVSIYTIGLGADAEESTIRYISSLTGGQYYYAPTSEVLSIIYKRISGQLQNQYLIKYTAPLNNPFPRTIQLTVNYKSLTVTDSIKYTTQKQQIDFLSGTNPFKLDEFTKNSRSYFYYKTKSLNNILGVGEEIRFINKYGSTYVPFGGTYLGDSIFQFWVDITRDLGKTTLQVKLPDSLIHNGSWIKFINKPSSFDVPLLNFPLSQKIDVFGGGALGVELLAGGVGAGPSIAAASLSAKGTAGMGLSFEMNNDRKEYITRRLEAGIGLKAESPAINAVVGDIQSGAEVGVMVKGTIGQTMLFPASMDNNAVKAKTLFLLETFSLGALSFSPDCSVLKVAIKQSLSLLDQGLAGAYRNLYYSNQYGINIEGKASVGLSVASGSGANQNKFKVAEMGGKMVFSGQFISYPQSNDQTIQFGLALEGGFSLGSLKALGADLGSIAGYTAGTDILLGANFNPTYGFRSFDYSIGLNETYQVIFGQKKLTRRVAFNVPRPVIARALSTENLLRGVAPFFSTSAPKMDFQIGKDCFLNSISNMFNYTTDPLDSIESHIVIETTETDANCLQIDASAKIDGALVLGGGLELGITLSMSDEFSKKKDQFTLVNGKVLPLAHYNSYSSSPLFSLKDEVEFLLKNAPLLVLDLINSIISRISEGISAGVDFALETLDGACEFGGNIASDIGDGLGEIASYSPDLPFVNSLKSNFNDPEIISGYISHRVETVNDKNSSSVSWSGNTLFLVSKCYRINIYNANKEIIPEFDPCMLNLAISPSLFQQYGFEEADKNKAEIFYYNYINLKWEEVPGDQNQHPDTISTEVGKSGTYAVGILYNAINDKNPPEIQGHYPVNGGIFDPDSLFWAVLYEPVLGVGIDPANSSLRIDGKDAGALWDPVNNRLLVRPAVALSLGMHTLEITASDYNNNKNTKFVQFSVNKTTSTPKNVSNAFLDISCYPNPMNRSLNIKLGDCILGNYDICICNLTGQRVKVLFNGEMPVSKYHLIWDRTNDNGQIVPAGIYFVRVKNEKNTLVKKIMVE